MFWLWVLVAMVVVVGGIYLAILPEKRRRRGLADINADGKVPSRRDATAKMDPVTYNNARNGGIG
jgi:hypothetical protein